MNGNRYAFILAGGLGSRLCLLSERRAKPAVPFGGKYRSIDFTLSSCVNSGIFAVGILTQYRPTSLRQHIGIGRPWDLARTRGGVHLLQPSLDTVASDWYQGTADAIYRNLIHLRRRMTDHVLVLSGDHVYKMDYNILYAFHEANRASVTVAVTEVPSESVSAFGILETDKTGRVVGFEEKPRHARSRLASMGVYLFDRRSLIDWLIEKNRSGYKMVNSTQRLNDMREFMHGKLQEWNCRAGQNNVIIRVDGTLGPCFPMYSATHDWGVIEKPKFDDGQLKEMKKGCQPHCFSTLNHNLAHSYDDGRALRWVMKQAARGFQGVSGSFN